MYKNASWTCVFFLVALFLHACRTCAQTLQSPEPWPQDNGLYLTTAGFAATPIRPLRASDTLCTKRSPQYPTGVAVLCVAASHFVSFSVDAQVVRREMVVPFYLNGDLRGHVRPWRASPGHYVVACTLPNNRVYTSRITVECWPFFMSWLVQSYLMWHGDAYMTVLKNESVFERTFV